MNSGSGQLPRHHQVMPAKPVRFVFCPGRVETVQELATCLGMMGLGVVGPMGHEALVANGVDHLFEREAGSQIITPGVTGIPNGAEPS
jgi:hypothetical protein